ncbi:MAG TPA: purine-nucleoside phosphorylase, partial [Rubrobacter sp.]|nr:purine-nucleoside phosphorylase [Rubrobacter sp.]
MSPVHVRAEPGDFAESVLLPGDPLRAKYIAENFFDDARLVTEERGMLGYTGTYKGEPVSVQATGMGCPSAAIVTEELIQLGVKNLLRVGTCGGYSEELRLGDLIVATSATAQDGTVSSLTRGVPYAPAAHFDIVHAAHHAAESAGRR